LLHLNAVAVNRVDIHSVRSSTTNLFRPARIRLVRSWHSPRSPQADPGRLSSVFDPFSVFQPIPPLSPKAASLRTIPLRRSGPSLRFYRATPLRRRLTSFTPATVAWNSIMRHRPLSRRRSAIGSEGLRPGRSIRCLSPERHPGSAGNAHGVFQTLRSFNPACQAEDPVIPHLHSPPAVS